MKFKTTVSHLYHCTLERAFKTPMLCDVSKVHTGFGVMPKVTHVSDDENWGQPGSSKKVYLAASISQKGGYGSMDHVIERIENQYWKIQVDDFQSWMLGFNKFVGEWETSEIERDRIKVNYTYTLYATNPLFYLFNWIFTKTFWRVYMGRVMKNIERMIKEEELYLYD